MIRDHKTAIAVLAASSMLFSYGSASATEIHDSATNAASSSVSSHREPRLAVQTGTTTDGVSEVRDGSGVLIGYAVDPSTRAALDQLAAETDRLGQIQGFDWWRVAKCVGSLSAFLALTVFPSARVAKLAVRIGGLVKKYGVKKVAQILTRTYKGSDVNAEAIFKEIAKQATGVAVLEPCIKG